MEEYRNNYIREGEANVDTCTSPAVLETLRRIHQRAGERGANAERLLLGALGCTTVVSGRSEEDEAPPCFLTIVGDDNPIVSVVHDLSVYGSSGFCAKGPLEGRVLAFVNHPMRSIDDGTSSNSLPVLPPIVKAPALDTSLSLFGPIESHDDQSSILDTVLYLWSEGQEDYPRQDQCYSASNFDFWIDFYQKHDIETFIRSCDLKNVTNPNAKSGANAGHTQVIKLEDSDDEPQICHVKNGLNESGYTPKAAPQTHLRQEKQLKFPNLTKLMWIPREWASYLLLHSDNGSTLSPYRAFQLINKNILDNTIGEDHKRQFRKFSDPILKWLALACISKPSSSSEVGSMDETSSCVSIKWESILYYPPKLKIWAKKILMPRSASTSSSTNNDAKSLNGEKNTSQVQPPELITPLIAFQKDDAHRDHVVEPKEQRKNEKTFCLSLPMEISGSADNDTDDHRHILLQSTTPSSSQLDLALTTQRHNGMRASNSFEGETCDDSSVTIASTSSFQNQHKSTSTSDNASIKRRRDVKIANLSPKSTTKSSLSVATSSCPIKCLGMVLISSNALNGTHNDIEEERQKVEEKYNCKLYIGQHKKEDGGGYKFVVAHETLHACKIVLDSIQGRLVKRSVLSAQFKKKGSSSSVSGVHVAVLVQIPESSVQHIRSLFWTEKCRLRQTFEQIFACRILFAGNGGDDITDKDFGNIKNAERFSKFPPHYFSHNRHPIYKSKYDLFTPCTSSDTTDKQQTTTCVLVTGFVVNKVCAAASKVLAELEEVCTKSVGGPYHAHQQQRHPDHQPNLSLELAAGRRSRNPTVSNLNHGTKEDGSIIEGETPFGKKRRVSSID